MPISDITYVRRDFEVRIDYRDSVRLRALRYYSFDYSIRYHSYLQVLPRSVYV